MRRDREACIYLTRWNLLIDYDDESSDTDEDLFHLTIVINALTTNRILKVLLGHCYGVKEQRNILIYGILL
jgi:hypothetical protein